MRRFSFKSGLIGTLPNVSDLDMVRVNLYSSKFEQKADHYERFAKLPANFKIQNFTQVIPLKEAVNPMEVKERIVFNNLEGFLLPTSLLAEALKQHPLPISAQKQQIIDHICRMNNGKQNEAEAISIEVPEELQIRATLPPNLASQIISELHQNRSSRLTIGEAKSIRDEMDPTPYGEALLQVSHLTHHALDLDMSTEITTENINQPGIKKLKGGVSSFENCFSLPYRLTDSNYSPHGYILYLKGRHITPEKIVSIIGLQHNGIGGLAVVSGSMHGSILSHEISKGGFFGNDRISYHQQHLFTNHEESLGSLVYDPLSPGNGKHGLMLVDGGGVLNSLDGEVLIAFYPLLQSYHCEWVGNNGVRQ